MNQPLALSLESVAAWQQVYRELEYAELMTHALGLANDRLFATLISGQSVGYGVLPPDLGLGAACVEGLVCRHFPGARFILPAQWDHVERLPEHDELRALLLRYRAQASASEIDLAEIIALACSGSDHLWQDLGLYNRGQLSVLMCVNFPKLAELNTGDMKWKKFLYKRLCEEEGIYVCRSPSCTECKDHDDCFGPES